MSLKRLCIFSSLILVLVIAELPQGTKDKEPLKCYMCNNELSFEDCTYYQSNGTCKPHEDRCIKAMWDIATIGSITTGYIKGCTTKDMCTEGAYDMCNHTDGYVNCEVLCCEGNNCNTAGNMTSGYLTPLLILLACILYMM